MAGVGLQKGHVGLTTSKRGTGGKLLTMPNNKGGGGGLKGVQKVPLSLKWGNNMFYQVSWRRGEQKVLDS